ncbi:MAG: hypothetical protein NC345_14000, partial [Lachnospira sp.]|nr:hypothetical protein [Lachnospira sp.]
PLILLGLSRILAYKVDTTHTRKENDKMKFRNDVTNITNELAQGQGLDISVIEIVTEIQNYCMTNKVSPRKNEYRIENGVLFINQKAVKRVAPLPPKAPFSEEAYYWEGRILAAHEEY